MILVGLEPSIYQQNNQEISFIKRMAVDLFTRTSAILLFVA